MKGETMIQDYINHSAYGSGFVLNGLPIILEEEFDFYRYVTFTDSLYGKTVSELHNGNLRFVTAANRYADLFGGEKISYWAATPKIAQTEWKKHNPNEPNHLLFWAYDDNSSTFPTIKSIEPLVIIDGIQLEFVNILEKCDRKEPLSVQDKELIEKIKETNPDCLAYKSHAKTKVKNRFECISPVCEANFMFFEKGFRKLSIRELRLNVNHNKNRNRIVCAGDCDYTPYLKNYGMYFSPTAKVKMDMSYLKTDEYVLRKTICEELAKYKFGTQ